MFTAFICTGPTRGGTCLAVVMIVLLTLFGTPLAHLGTEPAVFRCKFTIRDHQFNTDQTGFNTLHTTLRAVVLTFFTGHVHQTVLAVDPALLAGLYTTFIIRYHIFCFRV